MKIKLSNSTVKSLPTFEKATELYDTEIKGFMLRIQPSGVKTFYYCYRNRENRKQRFKIGNFDPTMSIAQARDKAIVIAGKVAEGVDVQSEKMTSRKQAIDSAQNTLSSFLDEKYTPWAISTQKSGKETVDAVRRFKKLLDLPLTSIKINHLEEWRIETLARGLTRSTINRMTSAFRGVITRAVEWGYLDEHPMKNFKNLKTDSNIKIRYLSGDENARLMNALESREHEKRDSRDRGNAHRTTRHRQPLPNIDKDQFADHLYPMIILAMKSGLRRGELFDIQWGDINFTLKQLTVRGEIAKSGNTRHIPLPESALSVLLKWKAQSKNTSEYSRVFPSDNGGRLTTIKKSFTNLMVSAGIQNFRFHDLRHDYASQLVMTGAPLNTVRELMGHDDIETTLRYAHLAPSHKSAVVDLLDQRIYTI